MHGGGVVTFARPVAIASVVSSADMAGMTDLLALARRQAERITEEAERRAGLIERAAVENDAARKAAFETRGRDELKRVIEAEALTKTADGFLRVAREADRIRDEFEALTPWLLDLVERSVRRIIGELDDRDLAARVVAEAVSELDEQTALAIRVRAADREALRDAMVQHPDRFVGVDRIRTDNTLKKGVVVIEGRGGLIDVSIESQLAALTDHLRRELTFAEAPA